VQVKPPPLNYLSLTPEDINAAFDKLNARKVEGRFVIKIS
jgi:D-arabinose 1-dehydrogenase-like Zn-dependent alcohol dehydrogenase